MQFILLIYKNHAQFAQSPEADKRRMSEECDRWYEALQLRGQGRQIARLMDPIQATTIRKEGDHFLKMDGPFAETKEVLGGWVGIDCENRAEAVQIAQTFPGVNHGFAVEVRPLFVEGQTSPCWRTD